MSCDPTVTQLLQLSRQGRTDARDRAILLVHEDLKRLAARMLRDGFRRSTLMQTTMLVNCAVERLLEREALDADNRRHLFMLLGRAMHDVLVEEARASASLKRGGGRGRIELETAMPEASRDDPLSAEELESLRRGLEALAMEDPAAAETVWLRFHCGRTWAETAEIMQTSVAVARGNWEYARAWLARDAHERRPIPEAHRPPTSEGPGSR